MEHLLALAKRVSEETLARRWIRSVRSSLLASMVVAAPEISVIMNANVHGVWVEDTAIRVSENNCLTLS